MGICNSIGDGLTDRGTDNIRQCLDQIVTEVGSR
jgi:hypothetical protein